MRPLLALALVLLAVLSPAAAAADSSTDAALALGAFAVFNQILSGTGIFGGPAPHREVVVYAPAPVYYHYYHPAPARAYAVRPHPGHRYAVPSHPHAGRGGWCPPGQAKKGRC